jgi:hypothetical protein
MSDSRTARCRESAEHGCAEFGYLATASLVIVRVFEAIPEVIGGVRGPVQNLNPNRARPVATVAYSFVYPLVASYCAMYHATVDTSSPKFRGGFGAWRHVGVSDERKQEVRRPRDTAVRSSVWLDLRSEPWWFAVGEIPPEVRFTVRWVDLWGFVLEEGSAAEHALRPTSVLASGPVSSGRHGS